MKTFILICRSARIYGGNANEVYHILTAVVMLRELNLRVDERLHPTHYVNN